MKNKIFKIIKVLLYFTGALSILIFLTGCLVVFAHYNDASIARASFEDIWVAGLWWFFGIILLFIRSIGGIIGILVLAIILRCVFNKGSHHS